MKTKITGLFLIGLSFALNGFTESDSLVEKPYFEMTQDFKDQFLYAKEVTIPYSYQYAKHKIIPNSAAIFFMHTDRHNFSIYQANKNKWITVNVGDHFIRNYITINNGVLIGFGYNGAYEAYDLEGNFIRKYNHVKSSSVSGEFSEYGGKYYKSVYGTEISGYQYDRAENGVQKDFAFANTPYGKIRKSDCLIVEKNGDRWEGTLHVLQLGCFSSSLPLQKELTEKAKSITVQTPIKVPDHVSVKEVSPRYSSLTAIADMEDQVRLNSGKFILINQEIMKSRPVLKNFLKFELINSPSYLKARAAFPYPITLKLLDKIDSLHGIDNAQGKNDPLQYWINELASGKDLYKEVFKNNKPLTEAQKEALLDLVTDVAARLLTENNSMIRKVAEAAQLKDYQEKLIQEHNQTTQTMKKKQEETSDENKLRMKYLSLMDQKSKQDSAQVTTQTQKILDPTQTTGEPSAAALATTSQNAKRVN